MRSLFSFFAILFAIIFLSACNSGSVKESGGATALEMPVSVSENDGGLQIPVAPSQLQLSDTVSKQVPGQQVIKWDKKIIKTGNLTLEAKSLKSFTQAMQPLLSKNGAYIEKEESRQGEGYHSSHWIIKVPVLQFEDLLNELVLKDVKVAERSINSSDVTDAWFDTRSRLEAKRAMRTKYSEFLGKAKNMEEVLQVQKEINNLQEEIESATARLEAMGNQSAYSTINLDVTEKGSGIAPVEETPDFFKRLVTAFKDGADGLSYILVGIVSIWPLLLILSVIFLIIKKRNSNVVTSKP